MESPITKLGIKIDQLMLIFSSTILAHQAGIEPTQAASEAAVLPLYDWCKSK